MKKIEVSRSDFKREIVDDQCPDASYLEGFESRMSEYERGDFGYIGVLASVDVTIPLGENYGVIQKFTSPGLWGIESDIGDDYLMQIFEDECETLAEMLRALGVHVI